MRPDRSPTHDDFWVNAGLILLGVLLGIDVLLWSVGQVAGLLSAHRWLHVDLAGAAGILFDLRHYAGDPKRAWPAEVRRFLPGPVGMYLSLTLVVLALVGVLIGGLVVWQRLRGVSSGRRAGFGSNSGKGQQGARWASAWQLRPLAVRRPVPGRVTLGRSQGWLRQLLAAEECHSVFVFGPPGSYKTTGLAVPAMLEWSGPVVATSIKPDLLHATKPQRERLGAVWVFDPFGISGERGALWTPLASCRTYAGARKMGRIMAKAADLTAASATDQNYWTLLGAKLLAVHLFAAAGTDRTMADVAHWIDIQEQHELDEALVELGDPMALDAWDACKARPDNTRGSVYGTAETLLDVYGDPTVAASADGCDLDLDALLTKPNNTLYLYAPENESERIRPLFETLLVSVVRRAQELAARQPDGTLDPRLLLCLDEAGNVAQIGSLPEWATTSRGQGIQLVDIWHDLSQLEARYGKRAKTVINGHRAKLFLSGLADDESLEYASRLIGEQAITQHSETAGDGRHSTTTSVTYRRLAPPEAIRQQQPGEGVLLYGHLPAVRLRLRPWMHDPHLTALVEGQPAQAEMTELALAGEPAAALAAVGTVEDNEEAAA